MRQIVKSSTLDTSVAVPPFSAANPPPAERDQPTSDPPKVGSIAYEEGFPLESLVTEFSSIPSARSSHTGEEAEENDPKIRKKRTREEVDPEEVTSSLLGSAKRYELDNPIRAVPLASKAPASPPKPTRLFNFGTRKTKTAPASAAKDSTPFAPPVPQSKTIPATFSKGKDMAKDGATASLTPPSSSKGQEDIVVELSHKVADPVAPSTSRQPNSAPSGILDGSDLAGIEDSTLTNDFQPFMRVVQTLAKGYLNMARSWDTTRLNLQSNKEHLAQVTSDRDSANARVTELEARVAGLEKELAVAKKKTSAALTKAKDALAKEQAALKKEEELTPRVQAIVNSLTEVLSSPPDRTDCVRVLKTRCPRLELCSGNFIVY